MQLGDTRDSLEDMGILSMTSKRLKPFVGIVKTFL